MIGKLISTAIIVVILLSCSSNEKIVDGSSAITAEGLAANIKEFASDAYQGRRPFTPGEEKALDYLEQQMKMLGLEPGNGASYRQEVPMVEINATGDPTMKVTGGATPLTLNGFDDYVLWTERTDSLLSWQEVPLVFAGFGVVAPEYNWNDYEGLDVKDKIVVVLVNDPGFGGTDTAFFKGNTMTYYGRWTYKYEEAARQGAKGCLVVHSTVPAGYGFSVVQNNWNSPHLYLDSRGSDTPYCEGIGWLSQDAATALFALAGLDLEHEREEARKPGFEPVSLNVAVSTRLHVKTKYNVTYNAVGKITGSQKPDEYIIYSAHWDHLGIGKANEAGDSIYNGAVDNAGGVATVLEIAKAFKQTVPAPSRTIVFLFVTAEEQGLWGSAYYTQHPIYPPASTLANLNVDFTNVAGKMKDITVIGYGQSTLEDVLRDAAAQQGRYLAPEPNPVAGLYFRSDHFNFAKVGIPALFIEGGIDHYEKGKAYGKAQEEDYIEHRYHQPTDEFNETWDLSGAVEDATLLYRVGMKIDGDLQWPQWKAGSEFKSVRDQSLQ